MAFSIFLVDSVWVLARFSRLEKIIIMHLYLTVLLIFKKILWFLSNFFTAVVAMIKKVLNAQLTLNVSLRVAVGAF